MKQEALIAWTSLYIAVGIMALLCAVLAVAVTADDWRTKRWRPALESGLDKTLLLPKIWLRWQRCEAAHALHPANGKSA